MSNQAWELVYKVHVQVTKDPQKGLHKIDNFLIGYMREAPE